MKPFTLFFFFLFGIVAGQLQGNPRLSLVYTVKNKSYTIDGFEGQNPFYVEAGKKVFPEAPGRWTVTGDMDVLRKYGFLPNFYLLEKYRRTFKDGPGGEDYYHVKWNSYEKFPSSQGKSLANQICWDTSKFHGLVVVKGWIHSEGTRAFLNTVDPSDLPRFRMEDFGGNYARELRKDGYPIFLFLNPETLEVYVPDSDHLKGKALLNWLAKVGTFEEFKSVWDSTYTSGLYSDGEQNPLHLVALYRRNDFLSRIPELADLANLKDENENTVAHYAAGIGNQEILEQLTDPKRSVNFANKDGDYPIHVAIENGHTDLVKWFVLELNLKNKMSSRNTSPMAAALNARRFEIVEFLEPLKPERLRIEKTSMDGLFLSLCYFGWPSMVEYMLRYYSGSLRISDEFDPVEPAIKSTNPEVLKLVLDRTKSLKSKDAKQSYLHMAAYEDVPQMVEPLLANGLDVNGVISNNVTALYVAVTNGNLDVTLELLKNGADPNIHPDGGVSPIWAATYLGNRDEIQALIEAGASCELKPDFANTMVEYATLYDVPEVVLIALEECLSPDYELYDEFPGVFVADYFESNGVRSVLEERGQLLESVKKPRIAASSDLDAKIKFVDQPYPTYPEDMMKRYGDQDTKVTAIFDKRGQLILPKFNPALPPDLTRHVREILKEWRISPATVDGEPVNLKVVFPLNLKKQIEKATIHEISALDVPPKPLKRVAPVYPRDMKMQRVQTTVVIVFIVNEDGSVSDVKITQGSSTAFNEAAVKAVEQWTFEPGMLDGKAVKTSVRLPLSFTLRE